MKVEVEQSEIEKLAINVLDDDNGISQDAFKLLHALCKRGGVGYITDEATCQNDRFFLKIDTARQFKEFLK